eukprot:11404726-Ditylum_brightwellii.AAC.1
MEVLAVVKKWIGLVSYTDTATKPLQSGSPFDIAALTVPLMEICPDLVGYKKKRRQQPLKHVDNKSSIRVGKGCPLSHTKSIKRVCTVWQSIQAKNMDPISRMTVCMKGHACVPPLAQ